jgi:2,4-diketo-3-deoxy-L-fuconate hydrolase
MRFARCGEHGNEHPAVIVGDPDHPVARDISAHVTDIGPSFWNSGGPQLLDGVDLNALPILDPDEVRLGAPIARPGKVVCIGLNYRDHAAESTMALPVEPIVFMKAPNTVVGPNDDIAIPRHSTKTDWEVELGVVIGREARYLADPSAAWDAIGGYVLSNDVSEREFQLERGGQWDKGKCCETFNPLGPWLVTPDELGDPHRLDVWLDVNGCRMQSGTTSEMIFGVDYIVWYLSQFMVLEPGDLINTGTPAGVGLGRTPQRFLAVGDRVQLGGTNLGAQNLRCVSADDYQRGASAASEVAQPVMRSSTAEVAR